MLKKKINHFVDFEAYKQGLQTGRELGLKQGKTAFLTPFNGTSIVITARNNLIALQKCIACIRTCTKHAYELLVVDDGSNDGTAEWLHHQADQLRICINPRSFGRIGAMNQGLMMARGSNVVLLHVETLVTDHWLSKLLAGLSSDSAIGLVEPEIIAAGENMLKSNKAHKVIWESTHRLYGACLLIRRDALHRIGYMDEAVQTLRCLEDYAYRAHRLGLKVVRAKDTKVVHPDKMNIFSSSGSNPNDSLYLVNKWGKLAEEAPLKILARAVDFYPSNVVVKGVDAALYWVEAGVRYKLESGLSLPFTRVSMLELRSWLSGGTMSEEQVYYKIKSMSAPSNEGSLAEGRLMESPDGQIYQYYQKKLHRIESDWARTMWHLDNRPTQAINQMEMLEYEEGSVIMAPPILRYGDI